MDVFEIPAVSRDNIIELRVNIGVLVRFCRRIQQKVINNLLFGIDALILSQFDVRNDTFAVDLLQDQLGLDLLLTSKGIAQNQIVSLFVRVFVLDLSLTQLRLRGHELFVSDLFQTIQVHFERQAVVLKFRKTAHEVFIGYRDRFYFSRPTRRWS
ncbi:hypothetical protein [Bdellovibrio sp. NC01]|uniref:hypothetical protein n=1 Tax=Bdellovibrio sp. NC01 TaxID=2220073 RepID=UPI00143D9FC5|nr:hypothetical protein [Bdellovibrio sp. NC01]